MSLVRDMMGKPTPGELELRAQAADAQKHAEALEEKLKKVDPREFTDLARHVDICFERQIAAQAWRKTLALQSRLNGAENRRYSRGLLALMALGFGSQAAGVKVETIGEVIKAILGVI